jgi:hypothetical protein
MQEAYDNESLRRPGSGAVDWMAPVGHAFAHSSHIVHRAKSMTGKPNDTGRSNGMGSVRIPVLRLLARMLSMM